MLEKIRRKAKLFWDNPDELIRWAWPALLWAWRDPTIFKVQILAVLIFSMSQALIFTPDTPPIMVFGYSFQVPVIGLNPAYVSATTCAQFKPLMDYGQKCLKEKGAPQLLCVNQPTCEGCAFILNTTGTPLFPIERD